MTPIAQPERRKLPQVWRHAIWHSDSGLVVSPFDRTLPSSAASSNSFDDQKKPRLLANDNIYLAFYPRRPLHRSDLFSALAVSEADLSLLIHQTTVKGQPSYCLEAALREKWVNLETSLLDIADLLYTTHPRRRFFPPLTPPRFPYEYGYATSHNNEKFAFSCAKKSRNAFSRLSAYVSFGFSLWLGAYEDNCLDAVFKCLSEKHPRVWLQYLRESIVCQFTPGLRPGGFLNPYTTNWGPFLELFTRASVPFWLLWGKNYRGVPPADSGMTFYLPPEECVDIAKRREASFVTIILPLQHTYHFEIPHNLNRVPVSSSSVHISNISVLPTSKHVPNGACGLDGMTFDNPDGYISNINPDAPPPPPPTVDRTVIVESGSGQRAGELWEAFFERQMTQLQSRKKNEDMVERQRRENLQKLADSSGPTKKSSVFLWEQDEVTRMFYRRTRVIRAEAYSQWRACTPRQRFFWSHTNQWDLCPHLPATAPGEPRPTNPNNAHPDDEDHDDYPAYSHGSITKPAGAPVVDAMLQTVRELTARDEAEAPEYIITFFSVLHYLCRRHGFFADLKESWHPDLHEHEDRKFCIAKDKVGGALKNMLYGEEELPANVSTSIVDFYNLVLRPKLRYFELPSAWDISRYMAVHPPLIVNFKRIRVQRVTSALSKNTELYILRPGIESEDPSPWFIATTSATTVLIVYRSPWDTMFEIGRGLLRYGIPFRTVVERKTTTDPTQSSWRYKTRGLGSRPKGFEPTFEDFAAYENARDKILQSGFGRVARLLGGLVGRMALEVVPDVEVLDGPVLAAVQVVGYHGDTIFVDDPLGEDELDIICGVYVVDRTDSATRVSHSSFWPKYNTWLITGLAGDQWLPIAETWYKRQVDSFRDNKFKLKMATEWKESLRFSRTPSMRMYAGSERLAADFLGNSSRAH